MSAQTSRVVDNPNSRRPFDDVENLYIGHIVEAPGRLRLKSDPHQEDKQPNIALSGEVLFHGKMIDGDLVMRRLRRVALYGTPFSADQAKLIGVLSLSGPLINDFPEPIRLRDQPPSVQLQLHYSVLSRLSDKERSPDEGPAHVPTVERIAARLEIEPVEAGETTVQARLRLIMEGLVNERLGLVEEIALDSVPIVFHLAGTKASDLPPMLAEGCWPPFGGCGAGLETVTRRLGLKFVSFCNTNPPADVEAFCAAQLAGVCEVWRNKAAFLPTVQWKVGSAGTPRVGTPHVAEATLADRNDYCVLDETQVADFDPAGVLGLVYHSDSAVGVYLVDELWPGSGGGVTYNEGVSGAYIILQVDAANANPYLLAHELGHVLALAHPDGAFGLVPTSWASVMQPTGGAGPNPNANSLYNCRIMIENSFVLHLPGVLAVDYGLGVPLNPLVHTTTVLDCFRPDL